MPETILLALIVAKVKKLKIKPLLKAYALYPFFLLEIIYWYLQIQIFSGNYSVLQYAEWVQKGYLYLMLIPIVVYKLFKPALIGSGAVIIGTLLNNLAMSANNGQMPVFPTLSYYTGYFSEEALKKAQSFDEIHAVGSQITQLIFLTDYIDLGYCILSIGDLFIHAFVFIVLFATIKHLNKYSTIN